MNFPQMTEEEYHAAEGLGGTAMRHLVKSVPHYLAWRAEEKEVTEAMKMGKLLHLAILESDKFLTEIQNYEVKPEGMSFTTKEGKAWRSAVETAGKTIVTAGAIENVKAMAESVLSHPHWSIIDQMMGAGEAWTEVPLLADYKWNEFFTIKIKGKIDLLIKQPKNELYDPKIDRYIVVDIKTHRPPVYPFRVPISASTDKQQTIVNRFFKSKFIGYDNDINYDVQLKHYCNIVEILTGGICDAMIIAVENESPYAVAPFYILPAGGGIMRDAQDSIDIAFGHWYQYLTHSVKYIYPTDPITINSINY